MKNDIDIQAKGITNCTVNGKTTKAIKTIKQNIPRVELLSEDLDVRIERTSKISRAAMPVDLALSLHSRLRYSVVVFGRN